jgi:hypothetical protein
MAASPISRILLSRWVWGPVFAACAFFGIQSLPSQPQILSQFVSQRGLLAVEVGLFFAALAGLIGRAARLVHERRALSLIVIDKESLAPVPSSADRARALLEAIAVVPGKVAGTKLVGRIRAACEYVARRGNGAALEEHLRYLADLAVDEQAAAFASTRTMIWLLPALGLLGTLVGLAQFAGEIDAENLAACVPLIVGGLAGSLQAFALSCALALILALVGFAVERGTGRVLARVERFGVGQLAHCLGCEEQSQGALSEFAKAESEAASQLLARTETLINHQTKLWQAALEDIRGRWQTTSQEQQAQFAASLKQGMSAGLASHVQQLDDARSEFLNGFRAVGLELSRVTAGLEQMGQEHQEVFHRQVTEIWSAMQAQMASARDEHQAHFAQSLKLLDSAVRGWRSDLTEATKAIGAQVEELRRRGEILSDVAGHEGELVRLQNTLAQNLQSVRAIEAFEESIHSLNAAVHMLTIRAKAHAA